MIGEDDYVLIYDSYDIWQVHPQDLTRPVNLTSGYGKRNSIKLRILSEQNSESFAILDTLLLSGFNTKTKYNGFFFKTLGKLGSPELISMGPFLYTTKLKQSYDDMGKVPMKARDVKAWIVLRQSLDDAPNLYFTNNFKNYTQLTDLEPQKGYNWLTADLFSWRQLDSSMSQAERSARG